MYSMSKYSAAAALLLLDELTINGISAENSSVIFTQALMLFSLHYHSAGSYDNGTSTPAPHSPKWHYNDICNKTINYIKLLCHEITVHADTIAAVGSVATPPVAVAALMHSLSACIYAFGKIPLVVTFRRVWRVWDGNSNLHRAE